MVTNLASLSRRDLLLLLVLDLVTHSIICVLLSSVVLVDTGSRSLTLDPVVAGGLETTITHGPHLLADRLGEVSVVGDDKHTTLEDLQGLDESGERLTIEVV